MKDWLNLQLFAEGGGSGDGGAAAGGDGAAAEGSGTGVTGENAAPQQQREYVSRSGRRYVIPDQDQSAQPQQEQPPQNQAKESQETFEDLIKGRFKKDYDERVQSTINARFKKANETQARMDKLDSIMPQLLAKYGLAEDASIDDFAKKVSDDDSIYEEEALEKGMTVQQVRDVHRLTAENERMKRMEQERTENAALEAHFSNLSQQAEQLRQTVPDFDLMSEVQNNPTFARLTAPGVGISVQDAYFATHRERTISDAMAYGANRAATQVAQAVRSNSNRPTEAGVGNQVGFQSQVDPSKLSRDEYNKIRERVRRGEKISF